MVGPQVHEGLELVVVELCVYGLCAPYSDVVCIAGSVGIHHIVNDERVARVFEGTLEETII